MCRIDEPHRSWRGPQQDRLKSWPCLAINVFQPASVTGYADTVQDDCKGLTCPDVSSLTVLLDRSVSAKRVANASADDMLRAGLAYPAADHARPVGPRCHRHDRSLFRSRWYLPQYKLLGLAGSRRRRPSMLGWLQTRIVTVMGMVALILGILIAVIEHIAYGSSVGENLLATASGILISLAVATLIIDRINRLNKQRQWLVVYEALHGLLAAAFVDVMRLIHIHSNEAASMANVSRRQEFIDTATMRVNDLRGTLQGLVAVMDPAEYATCRTIERRLSWMVHIFSVGRSESTIYTTGLKIMVDSGELLAGFISKGDDTRYSDAIHSAKGALQKCGLTSDQVGLTLGEVMSYRFRAQSQLLEANRGLRSRTQGIYYDIDNELSIYYFALDQRLLAGTKKADPAHSKS